MACNPFSLTSEKNYEFKCYVKLVHVNVTTPYNFDSTTATNAESTTTCDTDLCNQKGSSVDATLSMALVFVIYSFSE